ncbi:MAG: STAS domain-containing protein [Candidatus Kapabacteria bacterium]|nr:STAS domain-containing protein [Candidatus Kapabacteria bacterium]
MGNDLKFAIECRTKGDINCIELSGYLDAHTAPQLEDEIHDLVKSGKNKIIVNFNNLDYISSAGLGVFMAFIEDVRFSGGDIKLSSMRPKVFSVFDLLGFPVLFDIVQNDEAAIEKFNLNPINGNE